MKIHTEHNPRNAAIIITAVVSLATGFMRAGGRSGISTSAACMAPWQLEDGGVVRVPFVQKATVSVSHWW